jgi:hypothetical protein
MRSQCAGPVCSKSERAPRRVEFAPPCARVEETVACMMAECSLSRMIFSDSRQFAGALRVLMGRGLPRAVSLVCPNRDVAAFDLGRNPEIRIVS